MSLNAPQIGVEEIGVARHCERSEAISWPVAEIATSGSAVKSGAKRPPRNGGYPMMNGIGSNNLNPSIRLEIQ
ncbi:MAG: hypothetical protein M1347_02740 [Chloroflexi bacterium]|nr:hypothetical protein [Chloroflexota bacterium]